MVLFQASIHAFIAQCCPQIHAARRRVLFAVVAGALRGGVLSLSGLGRALPGAAYARHKIKRVDRLLGNRKLNAERSAIYAALTRRLIAG